MSPPRSRRVEWLMVADLIVLDGSTFFLSDAAGDIRDRAGAFFFRDVRHLSEWSL